PGGAGTLEASGRGGEASRQAGDDLPGIQYRLFPGIWSIDAGILPQALAAPMAVRDGLAALGSAHGASGPPGTRYRLRSAHPEARTQRPARQRASRDNDVF